MNKPKLGVISGSIAIKIENPGDDNAFASLKWTNLTTPFGEPSDGFQKGQLKSGETVILLNRHGKGHSIGPSAINYRANVWGMKKLGVTHLLSICAVGSLEPWIEPGKTLLIPNQLIDFTKGIRRHTFFDGERDLVAHFGFADPICDDFSAVLARACAAFDKEINVHVAGESLPLVIIEGPTFSTRAESRFFRESLHAVAVGMTALPEAKLAREAGLCYTILGLPTDYDSWRETESGVEPRNIADTIKTFEKIPPAIIPLIANYLPNLTCPGHGTLRNACASDLSKIERAKLSKYSIFQN